MGTSGYPISNNQNLTRIRIHHRPVHQPFIEAAVGVISESPSQGENMHLKTILIVGILFGLQIGGLAFAQSGSRKGSLPLTDPMFGLVYNPALADPHCFRNMPPNLLFYPRHSHNNR